MSIKAGRWVWVDGAIVPWEDARIHVLTHGLQYGTGVFEGLRSHHTGAGPAVFRLPEHVRRLVRSARAYGIDMPYSATDIETAVIATLSKNALGPCYIRPAVFVSYGDMGVDTSTMSVSTVIGVYEWEGPAPTGGDGRLRAVTAPWRRPSSDMFPSSAKATGPYILATLAKLGATRAGADEAILLTAEGMVAEGTTENIFAVRNGEVLTPPDTLPILPGITRGSVFEICRYLGIHCEQAELSLYDLYTADEIFLTSTGIGVAGIACLDGRSPGNPLSPVTGQIKVTYERIVRGEVPEFTNWLTVIPSEAPR